MSAQRLLRLTRLQEKLTLGLHPPPDGRPEEESLKTLIDLFLKGGTNPEAESDIVAQRWRKVLWWVTGWLLVFDRFLRPQKLRNASYSSLCTASRATVAELLQESNLEFVNATVKGIMDEVTLVARTSSIHTGTLLEGEAIDIIRRTKPKDFKPSMLVDLEANRPIEVEVILGEIVRKAAEVGVPVPR